MDFQAIMTGAFLDELEKIGAAKEKDAGGFDTFLNGASTALKGGISSAARSAPSVQKGMARTGGGFMPAVVGAGVSAARKLPLPKGALNPGGGML